MLLAFEDLPWETIVFISVILCCSLKCCVGQRLAIYFNM